MQCSIIEIVCLPQGWPRLAMMLRHVETMVCGKNCFSNSSVQLAAPVFVLLVGGHSQDLSVRFMDLSRDRSPLLALMWPLRVQTPLRCSAECHDQH